MTLLISIIFISLVSCLFAEPNPPTWPSHVYVFDPSDSSHTQQIVDQVYKEQGGTSPPLNGQFSNDRYAFLFKPGSHSVNVNIGYYTSLYGTGVSPTDTYIQGVASWDGSSNPSTGALCNFWRSAENFQIKQDMMWSVSQASPLRKAYVTGHLSLSQNGYSSGGYLSDSVISGSIISGSQQQWFTRNSEMSSYNGGNWNMVFVGVKNAPNTHCNHIQYTTTGLTPIIAEKPYIVINNTGLYNLYIPKVETNKYGATKDYTTLSNIIDFTNVYVSTEKDDADIINSKLNSGLAVILTPGNYNLSSSIKITHDNAILMGIGFPVLTPTNGNNVITVGNNVGVRIVGPILLQGGPSNSDTLLQFGDAGGFSGDAANPGIIYDVFARVGGPNNPNVIQQKTSSMFTINSDNVIIDGTWLWRADHDVSGSVYNGNNPVNNGLIVNGNNVIVYELAVEHTLQDLVQWNGNNGKCFFYQSEFPYDVTADYGSNGYTSFRIKGDNFQGFGLGAYSYFRDHTVWVNSGFVGPSSANITNLVDIFLSGNGGISHIFNNEGSSVKNGVQAQYLCHN
eukprot:468997_1